MWWTRRPAYGPVKLLSRGLRIILCCLMGKRVQSPKDVVSTSSPPEFPVLPLAELLVTSSLSDEEREQRVEQLLDNEDCLEGRFYVPNVELELPKDVVYEASCNITGGTSIPSERFPYGILGILYETNLPEGLKSVYILLVHFENTLDHHKNSHPYMKWRLFLRLNLQPIIAANLYSELRIILHIQASNKHLSAEQYKDLVFRMEHYRLHHDIASYDPLRHQDSTLYLLMLRYAVKTHLHLRMGLPVPEALDEIPHLRELFVDNPKEKNAEEQQQIFDEMRTTFTNYRHREFLIDELQFFYGRGAQIDDVPEHMFAPCFLIIDSPCHLRALKPMVLPSAASLGPRLYTREYVRAKGFFFGRPIPPRFFWRQPLYFGCPDLHLEEEPWRRRD